MESITRNPPFNRSMARPAPRQAHQDILHQVVRNSTGSSRAQRAQLPNNSLTAKIIDVIRQ
jgi:hypothetical protein